MTKILLRHLTAPLSEEQIGKIRQEQHLSAPKECLGGQEKGFFFFTTKEGIEAQKEFAFDYDTPERDKCRYIVHAEIDLSEIRYPNWKLDTEAFADTFFSIFKKETHHNPVIFDDIKIKFLYTSHDAIGSVGFLIESDNNSLVYMTDTGYISKKNLKSNNQIY